GARQCAEPGGDAVDRIPRGGGPLHPSAAPLHPGARGSRKRNLLCMAGHINDLALGQPRAAERDGHSHNPSSGTSFSTLSPTPSRWGGGGGIWRGDGTGGGGRF